MFKKLIYSILFIVTVQFATAQQSYIDSLKSELSRSKNDTTNLILFGKIADIYSEINPDSSYYYANKMLTITKELDLKLEEIVALNNMSYALLNLGNYPRSLQTILSSIALAEDPHSEKHVLPSYCSAIDEFTNRNVSPHEQRLSKLGRTLQYAGILYVNTSNYRKALDYYYKSLPYQEHAKDYRMMCITYATIGRAYLALKLTDSALVCLQKSYDYSVQVDYNRYVGSILLNLARVYMAKGDVEKAKDYFRIASRESIEHEYFRGVVASNLALSDIFIKSGVKDSCLYYINKGLPVAYFLNAPDLLLRSYTALANYYKSTNNSDSTVKYQSLIIKINDSLFNSKQAQQFQNIDFDEQQRQQQIETAKADYREKTRLNLLLGGLAVFLIIAIMLWRNSLQRKRANILLSKQKNELESTLATLKNTQRQLVQSEKMASLGELTAGIAHEIQNPLNFVNNFSELNTELIDEMKEQLAIDNKQQAMEIANDIKENEEKIVHHGKRADAIVKGMLQHSRSSSGVKEPTDINALADEYLRLAYHGLRAKDKSFNANFKTDFDSTIGSINIIPQDIGRVILNLITNAFYSVTEKKQQADETYEPTVTVSTKKTNLSVEIKVKDNGNGIPQKVLDKIFQPFFTTKPTGQGTGLGLSMSYDIITKGHGGEIKVNTKENEGTEFTIVLPA